MVHIQTDGASMIRSLRWQACLAIVLLSLESGLSPAIAQPRPLNIRAVTANDAIHDGGLAELRRRLGSLGLVESIEPSAADRTVAALRRGEIDMAIVPLPALRGLAPGFGVYDLAFAFPNSRSMMNFTEGAEDGELASQLSKLGLASLGTWYGGALVIASGKQALRSPSDFMGKPLAVFPGTSMTRQFKAVGAKAKPLLAPEIYAALAKGNDGAAELRWHQLALGPPTTRYVAETNHRFTGHVVVINQERFSSLPPETLIQVRQAVAEVSREVSALTSKREQEAREQVLASPHVTVLTVNEPLRNEWRMALRGQQGPEIRRIGGELLERAQSPVRIPLAVAPPERGGLTWNAWFQISPKQTMTELAAGNKYDFILDLGRGAYPDALAGVASGRVLAEIDRDPRLDQVTLLVRPLLMGSQLRPFEGTALGSRPLTIQRARLAVSPQDVDHIEARRSSAITLRDLAGELSVGEPLSWPIIARESGCARIALSIWDATGRRPLDYLIVNVPVKRSGEASPDCAPGVHGGELVAGLQGLLDVGPGEVASAHNADAALHLFDVPPAGDEAPSTVAVYADRAAFEAAAAGGEPPLLAWELDTRLSDFLGDPAKLQHSITLARDSFGKVETPYGDVVRQLDAALFGGRTEDDRQAAEAARAAMRRIAQGAVAPVVLVRYFSSEGEMRYVPLALLAANAPVRVLPGRVTVVQPLLGAKRAARGACFDAWNLAIPRLLDKVLGDDAELLGRNDWRVQGERLTWYEDNSALLRFLSTSVSKGTSGEALVLLAHHGEGTLTFSASARPDRILNEEVKREFGRGSIAVLAACSTTGVSRASRAFLQTLVRRGVEAFVVSPFQVHASFGTHLAVSFVEEANEARRHGETRRLSDLHERALARVIERFARRAGYKDKALEFQIIGYKDMALEFQIIGDHELRLCAGPR